MDLEVHLGQDMLRLYAPKWKRYLRLISARFPNGNNERISPLRPFALPEREEVLPLPADVLYCPRVEVGKLVLARRTWRVSYHDWRYDSADVNPGWNVDLFAHMLQCQKQLSLPDRVFAKVVGETKPIFVDFTNYFLVHAFYKMWCQHQGPVTFTEPIPDSADSWLQDDDGHYSCELRMGCYRSRSDR
jgi:hypothetical protein